MTAKYGSSLAVNQALVTYTPDNALINYSDYCLLSVTSARARFTRPTVDGQGFEFCHPGARVRVKTDSTVVRFRLRYTNLLIRQDTYNGWGAVLVNGATTGNFTREQNAAGAYLVTVAFTSSVQRTIEFVFPYCASVDFEGVDLTPTATLQAPTARPTTRYVAFGDSISHGFVASRVDTGWPYLLAAAKNYQIINHGYGGRTVTSPDGVAAAALSPTVATYLIGYNNFVAQTSLASFKSEYKNTVIAFRAGAPAVKLYCLTPTYSPNTNTLTLEMYRQQIRDGLTEIGNALNILVEGAALATNDVSHFPDGIHPSDSAAVQISAALAAVVVP